MVVDLVAGVDLVAVVDLVAAASGLAQVLGSEKQCPRKTSDAYQFPPSRVWYQTLISPEH